MKNNKTEVVRLTPEEKSFIKDYRKHSPEPINQLTVEPLFYEEGKSRVLVVGDLHCPFDLDLYFHHCVDIYNKFQCNKVVFIGDIIDSHFSSFHEIDPDGFGAGEELERAISKLERWYLQFPEATVILGNHDRIVSRKAFSGGIPKAWIKTYGEVLQTPNWEFTEYKVIDGVLYEHGEGGTARGRIKTEHQSIVQGHLHTQAYIDWIFNQKQKVFGVQVGTGIDFSSYSFAYAKRGKKPAVSCATILNGTHPFLFPMTL